MFATLSPHVYVEGMLGNISTASVPVGREVVCLGIGLVVRAMWSAQVGGRRGSQSSSTRLEPVALLLATPDTPVIAGNL